MTADSTPGIGQPTLEVAIGENAAKYDSHYATVSASI
jgi:hypothetical protein